MWDISNTTTWVKGNHTFNFGVNYRRWSLQRDLATDFLGDFAFSGRLHRQPGRGHAARLLLRAPAPSSPAPFSVAGRSGNPLRVQLQVFRPLHPGRLEGQLQADGQSRACAGTTATCPTRPTTAWAGATLDYAPGRHARGRPEPGARPASSAMAATTRMPGGATPKNPDRYKVSLRGSASPGVPTLDGKTVIRGGYGDLLRLGRGPRDRRRGGHLSVCEPRQLSPDRSARRTPLQTTDRCSRASRRQGRSRPRPTASSRSISLRRPEEPVRAAVVARRRSGSSRSDTTAELNYVGSKGANLLMRTNIAQALPYTPRQPDGAGRKPFPNFGVYIDSDWSGYSNYNALNAKLEHRGRGAAGSTSPTPGRRAPTASRPRRASARTGFNGWQGFLEQPRPGARPRPLATSTWTTVSSASFVWNLPFGKGEKFAGDAAGVKKALIGGWQVNGIYTWQHGFPITGRGRISAACSTPSAPTARTSWATSDSGGGNDIEQWFNTAAFAQPALGSVRQLRPQHPARARHQQPGPGLLQELRRFRRTRRLQFRLESFNAFNHPQFQNVSPNITVANFGVVIVGPARTYQPAGGEAALVSGPRRQRPARPARPGGPLPGQRPIGCRARRDRPAVVRV